MAFRCASLIAAAVSGDKTLGSFHVPSSQSTSIGRDSTVSADMVFLPRLDFLTSALGGLAARLGLEIDDRPTVEDSGEVAITLVGRSSSSKLEVVSASKVSLNADIVLSGLWNSDIERRPTCDVGNRVLSSRIRGDRAD